MSEFILRQTTGAKIEAAVERNDGNGADIEWLVTKDNFKSVSLLARGEAEIVLKTKPAPTPAAKPPVPELLLEPVGTVTVSATSAKFIVKDAFVLDTSRKAKVKISYLGDNFKVWFGDKIEDPITKQTLRYAKLLKPLVDAPIIAELGGEEKSETTATEIYALMAKQANGENGALLNNGWWNIFYVEDQNGVLRAVCVFWSGVGWYVGAGSVVGPDGWHGGRQVFSRN